MDLRGVEAADARGWKQQGEKVGSGLREFVEAQRRSRELGEDGEEPGPRRRLQDEIGRRQRGGGARREAKRDRRRELLQRLALGGTARMARQKRRDPGEDRKLCRGRRGSRAQRRRVSAQEQDGRGLASVVSRLPIPGALGVGAAEGVLHCDAQQDGVDALAALEMREDLLGGREDR